MNRGPVFIAGPERSGTSLIFALLASHPNIAMTRRTNMWTHFYDQYGDLSEPENFERCLEMMMKYKRLVVLKPDVDRIRREFKQGEPTYARLFALLEEHYAERLGKPRWGDKSLSTERYAAPIFDSYPGARILHMVRDPRDRYASVIKRWKYRRGGIGAGTAMWLTSMQLAKKNQAQYPENYMIVRYETLAFKPEETMRKICAFIDEEYTTEMFTMQGATDFRDQGGNSSYEKRKPGKISTKSIGRYKQVLSMSDIAFVQANASDEMQDYDYQLDPIQLDFNERLKFTFAERPLNTAKLLAWRVRYAIYNQRGRPLPEYRIVTGNGTS